MKSNYPAWPLIKFVLTLVMMGSIASCWLSIRKHHVEHKSVGLQNVTDKQLYQWYASTNEELFQNKLPHDIIFYTVTNPQDAAESWKDPAGNYYIGFNPYYEVSGAHVQMDMIHEMCHIKTWGEDFNHGPKFQSCMKDIAASGGFQDIW